MRVYRMHADAPHLDGWVDLPFDPKVIDPKPEPLPLVTLPAAPIVERPAMPSSLAGRLEHIRQFGPSMQPGA